MNPMYTGGWEMLHTHFESRRLSCLNRLVLSNAMHGSPSAGHKPWTCPIAGLGLISQCAHDFSTGKAVVQRHPPATIHMLLLLLTEGCNKLSGFGHYDSACLDFLHLF